MASREVNLGDRIFRWIAAGFAGLIVLTLAAMALQMVRASSLSIGQSGFGFLTSSDWDPVRGSYGALPYVFGTVVSSLLALLIAVPIALGVSIVLSELAPAWLRQPLGFVVELLAAIPSVVYGLWGVFVLAPWLRESVQPFLQRTLGQVPLLGRLFAGTPRGVGLLAGGLILAIMILPTIAAVSRDVMRAVPSIYREGALALGATRWEAIRAAVLPYARSGIVGAIVLGLGRALGETMAVTMVIGNRAEIPKSLFDPAYTMASVIANEFTEASEDVYLSALAEVGLVLFGVTLILNVLARLLVWRVTRVASSR